MRDDQRIETGLGERAANSLRPLRVQRARTGGRECQRATRFPEARTATIADRKASRAGSATSSGCGGLGAGAGGRATAGGLIVAGGVATGGETGGADRTGIGAGACWGFGPLPAAVSGPPPAARREQPPAASRERPAAQWEQPRSGGATGTAGCGGGRGHLGNRWRFGCRELVFGLGQLSDATVNFRERPDRGQILRSRAQHLFEFLARFVVAADLEQGSAEGDAGRKVCGMALQARPARGNRVVELARAAVFLREGRKSDRRRIRLDPASQFLNASGVGHWAELAAVYHPASGRDHSTSTVCASDDVLPRSSVTVRVTL